MLQRSYCNATPWSNKQTNKQCCRSLFKYFRVLKFKSQNPQFAPKNRKIHNQRLNNWEICVRTLFPKSTTRESERTVWKHGLFLISHRGNAYDLRIHCKCNFDVRYLGWKRCIKTESHIGHISSNSYLFKTGFSES